MNILIIGSGAREHAIASACHRSKKSPQLFCCGSHVNPGIAALTVGYWAGNLSELDSILQCVKTWEITLAIIGPEAVLEKGLADRLWEQGVPTIGPKQQSAQIETSKYFARDLMKRHAIPGLPQYQLFDSLEGVEPFLRELGEVGYVIKANGLMGGKGVKVAGEHLHTIDEALLFCRSLAEADKTFLIEQRLIGQEFSLMGFCDGKKIIHMPIVQDHKRAFENDVGPNTGGMGSYSDHDHSLPFLNQTDVRTAQKINDAVLQALMQETSESYIGILYGSFIATRDGVFVIEFNARFGDPESLNVLTILESDFVTLCEAMCGGSLSEEHVRFARKATVCKYVVPVGYPDSVVRPEPVNFSFVTDPSHLYFGSIELYDGALYTMSSRTAAYVGVADAITAAERLAELEIERIEGPVLHRKDIGTADAIDRRIAFMKQLRSNANAG